MVPYHLLSVPSQLAVNSGLCLQRAHVALLAHIGLHCLHRGHCFTPPVPRDAQTSFQLPSGQRHASSPHLFPREHMKSTQCVPPTIASSMAPTQANGGDAENLDTSQAPGLVSGVGCNTPPLTRRLTAFSQRGEDKRLKSVKVCRTHGHAGSGKST